MFRTFYSQRLQHNPLNGHRVSQIVRSGILMMALLLAVACEGPFDLSSELGLDLLTLSISPNSIVVDKDSPITFTVSPPGTYDWSVIEGSGSIASDGTYTPSGSAQYVTVQAINPATEEYGQATLRFEDGVTLHLLAEAITLYPGESTSLFAYGGTGTGYVFTSLVDNSGGSDVIGSTYIAGTAAGTDTVQVDDGANSATLQITVKASTAMPLDIDYDVDAVTITNATPIRPGDSISATLDYSHTILLPVGDDGSAAINWNAYVSTDNTLNGTVAHVGNGSLPGLTAGASSTGVDISGSLGSWPTEEDNYYLLIHITPETDSDSNNNLGISASRMIVAPDVSYQVPTPPSGTTVTSATPLNLTAIDFVIQNTGADNDTGTTGTWNTWLSDNGTWDLGDTWLQSGTLNNLESIGINPTAQQIITANSGNWPAGTGNQQVILEWNDPDDPGTKYVASGVFSVQNAQVDYTAVAGTEPVGGSVEIGVDPGISIWIENSLGDTGSQNISWTAWLSPVPDTIPGNSGDINLASGNFSGPPYPAPGVDLEMPLGAWSVPEDDYHLIVTWDASDDINPANNRVNSPVGTPFLVRPPDVDYEMLTAPAGGGTFVIDSAITTESFALSNGGSVVGTQTIVWTAWMSVGDDILDKIVDDPFVSGIENPLGWTANGGMESDSIDIIGNWPSTPDTNTYIIVEWEALDDINTGNNTGSSIDPTDVTLPVTNYIFNSIDDPGAGPFNAGSAIAGDFYIQNLGSSDDPGDFTWAVYASSDSIYNSGDVLIDLGTETGLAITDGSSRFGYSGNWPETGGDYYLITVIEAPYDPDTPHAAVGVSSTTESIENLTDYRISAVQLYPYGTPGADLDDGFSFISKRPLAPLQVPNSFTITEDSGIEGTKKIDYTVYASIDTILNPDTLPDKDTVLSIGSIKASDINGNGGNWPIPLDGEGPWPNFAAEYFLIIVIDSQDDSQPGNDTLVAGPVSVARIMDEDEASDNSGFYFLGPPEITPETNSTVEIDTSLLPNELIHIEGKMDNFSDFDSFNFTAGPGMTEISVDAEWDTSTDDIDLYFWVDGATEWQEFSSTKATEDYEGNISIIGLQEGVTYFIGVYFYFENDLTSPTGSEYLLIVQGLP